MPFERDFDNAVRLAIMDALLAGRTPSTTSVAQALHVNADDVTAAFDRLAASRAIVLDAPTRNVRMAAPLAGVETDFRVHLGDDQSVYANCVWDAYGIPAALHADAVIPASDAFTGEPLTLEVLSSDLTIGEALAALEAKAPAAVVVPSLPPAGLAPARRLSMRLHARLPALPLVAARFGDPESEVGDRVALLQTAGCANVATSLDALKSALRRIAEGAQSAPETDVARAASRRSR